MSARYFGRGFFVIVDIHNVRGKKFPAAESPVARRDLA